MKKFIFNSAKSIAKLIREKKVSCVEVVNAHIEQIQKVNPKINAVVQFFPEEALKKAKEADSYRAKRRKLSPLHGVPFTVKDLFQVKNAIVTGGITGLSLNKCEKNSKLIERLIDAGAILLGITNMPEAGWAFETDNDVYGRTNNPYNLKYTSGGSSGGEGAIIACGGSPLGLGSDLGGSIRIPSHFCGIAGIRPTTGRLSLGGDLFTPWGLRTFFTTNGPMARFVEDLAYTMPILAGIDWQDPTVPPVPLLDPEKVDISRLKIAYFIDNTIAKPTQDTADAIHKVIKLLTGEAKSVVEQRPKAVESTYEIFKGILEFDAAEIYHAACKSLGVKKNHVLTDGLFSKLAKQPYSAPQINQLYSDWINFRSEMLHFMEDYDVLISPVHASPALKHGTSLEDNNWLGFSYTMTHSLTGWPCVVVRCGTSKEGLPIGVQISAKPWREDVALTVAAFLEKQLGGWQKPELA
jgi:amidase